METPFTPHFTVALAGNPNVGKSTVFNALTGMNQHTGNWPGKTVAVARGQYQYEGEQFTLVDLPGTYSIMSNSQEEEIARDFLCFDAPDAVVVVCDATVLERNLNLVLQVHELCPKTIVCVNLMDEAKKKRITVDLAVLERELGLPVVGCSARSNQGLDELVEKISESVKAPTRPPLSLSYGRVIDEAADILAHHLPSPVSASSIPPRWAAVKVLDGEPTLIQSLENRLSMRIGDYPEAANALSSARAALNAAGMDSDAFRDQVVGRIVARAAEINKLAVSYGKEDFLEHDRKIDKILTGRYTALPVMLLLLAVVFFITITGANYPSSLLSEGLFWIQDRLVDLFNWAGAPQWLTGVLIFGVYRVLAWVIAVMLPPMAIFFPLFTLLEDSGYLPRVAFNLDRSFHKACACGKQALTMCMGFGCNAVGVTGCRIIDSPRERLIAIITNNFVPCNGRFPTLIAIISMFFLGGAVGFGASILSAILLTAVIVLGILMTFMASRILSKTVLRGVPSAFTLELPPYRRPQFGKVIIRSIFDRTLFVLGRAVAVAAPAGLIIWIMGNVYVDGASILKICSGFLDPFARVLGLDGVILLAFILGFPANEIVIPVAIMAYMQAGSILDLNLIELKTLLVDNGWTWLTALCSMLFCLMHWPCSTTCLTIKKETQSMKWTGVSFLAPTLCGMALCAAVAGLARLFGLA